MKRTCILFTLSAAIAVITLNSNSSGPANNGNGNKTGGPGASGTCANPGCHSGATGATGTVALRKKADNAPANGQYVPGQTYIVSVTGTHASLPKFGFQLMALKESGNTQAGTFGNLGTNQHTQVVSGITLVEQHHAIPKTGTSFLTEFEWTAPAAGTGNVKFYGELNAVDGTGTTSGDAVSPAYSITLAEAASAVETMPVANALNVYPNPVVQNLQVTVKGNGVYTLKVYSLDGKVVINQHINVSSNHINIPADFAAGTYMLELVKGTDRSVVPFVKQ